MANTDITTETSSPNAHKEDAVAAAHKNDTHEVRPIPFRRELVVDAGYLSHLRHIIHNLVEVDITPARRILREQHLSI